MNVIKYRVPHFATIIMLWRFSGTYKFNLRIRRFFPVKSPKIIRGKLSPKVYITNAYFWPNYRLDNIFALFANRYDFLK